MYIIGSLTVVECRELFGAHKLTHTRTHRAHEYFVAVTCSGMNIYGYIVIHLLITVTIITLDWCVSTLDFESQFVKSGEGGECAGVCEIERSHSV